MKRGDFIFVYGTLRRGQRADVGDQGGEFICCDAIRGRMYDCGWYPGVKVGEKDPPIVLGDVYRIRDGRLPPRLDKYEGYPHLYDRVQVTSLGGRKVWVYVHNGDMADSTPVPSGNWIQYIGENKCST